MDSQYYYISTYASFLLLLGGGKVKVKTELVASEPCICNPEVARTRRLEIENQLLKKRSANWVVIEAVKGSQQKEEWA